MSRGGTMPRPMGRRRLPRILALLTAGIARDELGRLKSLLKDVPHPLKGELRAEWHRMNRSSSACWSGFALTTVLAVAGMWFAGWLVRHPLTDRLRPPPVFFL